MRIKLTHRLETGRLVATPNALDSLNVFDVQEALERHINCDWGDVSPADWCSNNAAVKNGLRIRSAYKDSADTKFWIITEADRSYTTILLPSDY